MMIVNTIAICSLQNYNNTISLLLYSVLKLTLYLLSFSRYLYPLAVPLTLLPSALVPRTIDVLVCPVSVLLAEFVVAFVDVP